MQFSASSIHLQSRVSSQQASISPAKIAKEATSPRSLGCRCTSACARRVRLITRSAMSEMRLAQNDRPAYLLINVFFRIAASSGCRLEQSKKRHPAKSDRPRCTMPKIPGPGRPPHVHERRGSAASIFDMVKDPRKAGGGLATTERRSTRRDRKPSSPVFLVDALRHWRWHWSRQKVWKESQCLRRATLLNRPSCFQMVQLQWCHSCRERPYWLRPSIAWYHDRSTHPSKFLVRLRMYRQLTMRR